MIFQLSDDIIFPDPALAEADGLLAIGGDLSPARLRLAYKMGIFPWYSEDEPICWYSPHERCVITPESLQVSRTMKKLFARNAFEIRIDTAFEEVIGHCATVPRPGQDGTWIHPEMIDAYSVLHLSGEAHSIEAWRDGKLVGGMYGIKVNKVFCGESMFSLLPNASKYVLIHILRSGFCSMLDCQLPNPHLASLGSIMISRRAFMDYLGS